MLQQFGSRKNVGASSSSDFLRAKRINAIRAAGDIKANTATSGYEPITIVQFNSVVQELSNISFKTGGGGNVRPPLPPIEDSSFVFQVATTTAVFSFDATAPSPANISWGGPGSLTTVVYGSQTTYQYTYSDGNQYHNVTMSNVSNVQEVSIYQTPRPAAPDFTISGVTPTALDTYTLHISPVSGATSYILELDGVPSTIIQPTSSNLTHQITGVCGRTYTNALATAKQGRVGDFSSEQNYSIPPLPKPYVSLTATGPTTFTATVNTTIIPSDKRKFQIYQLSGGIYSNVVEGLGPSFQLTGQFHTNQTVYANLVYNMNSTISSDSQSVLLPDTLKWVAASQLSSGIGAVIMDINQSTGTAMMYMSNIDERTNNYVAVTRNIGQTFERIDSNLNGFDPVLDRIKIIQYLTDNTWFIGCDRTSESSRVYKSIDDGSSWTVTTFPNVTYINSIATNNQSDIVIGGIGNTSTTTGLYYSSNRGVTWDVGVGTTPYSGTTAKTVQVVYTPCAWFAMGANAANTDASARFTGLVYSENGILWKTVSGAFPSEIDTIPKDNPRDYSKIKQIAFDPSKHLWVFGKDQYTNGSDYTLMWSSNASEWYPATSGAPSVNITAAGAGCVVNSVLYANNVWLSTNTTAPGGILRSVFDTSSILRSTDGKNWNTVTQEPFTFPFGIAKNPINDTFLAFGIRYSGGNLTPLFSSDGTVWMNTVGDEQDIMQCAAYDISHSAWLVGGLKSSLIGGASNALIVADI